MSLANAHPRPVRILIIEDSDDILFILKTELESLGYSVEVAREGVKGLETARAFRPDVIFSDIGMPGIDGFELLDRVRQTAELAAIPVVALTGFGPQHDAMLTRMHGFNAHVTKPVDGILLSSLIQTLIAGKPASSTGL